MVRRFGGTRCRIQFRKAGTRGPEETQMTCCPDARVALNERHRMRVRYTGGRSLTVIGPATGTVYRFSGLSRSLLLDPRDAFSIARSSLFRIEELLEVSTDQVTLVRARSDADA